MPVTYATAERTRIWSTKVPAITATFWVIKVLSTTIGETFSDYLTVNVGLGAAVTDAMMATALATALIIQFRTRKYTPWIYWLCVVLVSIVGTQITDFCTDTLGVSLYLSTAVFAVVLAIVFAVWYRQERTLAIASIDTPRREGFYWGAILTTFALGTAAGDLATEALGLGFRNGILIFGGLILAAWIARKAGAGQVLTFWIAYVLTRPLGASMGDFLTQDKEFGGLALGASATSLLFFAVILVLVAREQLLANRHGVAVKGTGPAGGHRADYAWAGTALAVVAAVGWGLGAAHSSPTVGIRSATRLGDLTSFATITADVEAKVTKNDLPGGKTRIKDLEVAWDDAEAGLKPRDPARWRRLDGEIDDALTALRATNPDRSGCSARLSTLLATLNEYDGIR